MKMLCAPGDEAGDRGCEGEEEREGRMFGRERKRKRQTQTDRQTETRRQVDIEMKILCAPGDEAGDKRGSGGGGGMGRRERKSDRQAQTDRQVDRDAHASGEKDII